MIFEPIEPISQEGHALKYLLSGVDFTHFNTLYLYYKVFYADADLLERKEDLEDILEEKLEEAFPFHHSIEVEYVDLNRVHLLKVPPSLQRNRFYYLFAQVTIFNQQLKG